MKQSDFLDEESREKLHAHFQIKIPRHFQEQEKLFWQVSPQLLELQTDALEQSDPIGDGVHTVCSGLIHRYPKRVLLTATHRCAMYCRFCFRKEKVSHAGYEMGSADLQKAFDYIKSHPEINEVILSGGDPLILSDQKLQLILESLDQIEHIRVIRFHTRILSAAAHRISSAFLKILSGLQKQIWFVVHLNVAEEMNPPFLLAAKALQKQGVILVSQSVLLKQINAQSEDLVRLFEGLYQIGIKPYYLHYPDLTPGTNHFRIPLTQAIAILKRVSVQLSGIAMPDFIVDIPRGMGKIRLSQFQASHIKTTEKKSQDDLQVYQEHWVFESPLTGEKKEVVYPFC